MMKGDEGHIVKHLQRQLASGPRSVRACATPPTPPKFAVKGFHRGAENDACGSTPRQINMLGGDARPYRHLDSFSHRAKISGGTEYDQIEPTNPRRRDSAEGHGHANWLRCRTESEDRADRARSFRGEARPRRTARPQKSFSTASRQAGGAFLSRDRRLQRSNGRRRVRRRRRKPIRPESFIRALRKEGGWRLG